MKNGRICLVGERDPRKKGHQGIEASIAICAQARGHPLEFEWVATSVVMRDGAPAALAGATGIWCVPGSPYASTEGALAAIRHAREQAIPFIGTCGGFQHALMEFCSSVLGCPAMHEELSPGSEAALIAKLACPLIEARSEVSAVRGSAYERLMGAVVSEEEFHCGYGVAPRFEPIFAGSDIEFVARDEAGQVRVFWHRKHPFFVGSLFQPERRGLSGESHPLVRAFVDRTEQVATANDPKRPWPS